VAAKARTTLPVSCVEQGRWRYTTRHFGHGGSHSSPKLRHVLKKSVSESALGGQGHGSDQGAVWKEVGRQMSALGATSETCSMADTYEAYRGSLAEFAGRLKCPEGATGLAVAVGGQVVSVDLFDRADTCRKVWDRLLTGVVLDALEAGPGGAEVGKGQVQEELARLRGAPWQQTQAAGVGEEYRADADGGSHATVLALGGSVIHGSLVVAE
jgi:hypothetical protein